MIPCPNCNHSNPEGAVQCEACFTPLPTRATCPSCGAEVLSDANFCGQCGASLAAVAKAPAPTAGNDDLDLPGADPVAIDPLVAPDPLPMPSATPAAIAPDLGLPDPNVPDPIVPDPVAPTLPIGTAEPPAAASEEFAASAEEESAEEEEESTEISGGSTLAPEFATPEVAAPSPPAPAAPTTKLQQQQALLYHVQTATEIDLPQHLPVIHIGKPNSRIPPDIDVSGFPNAEVVSRIHADIRVEAGAYYLEDTGSSNGTYVNNLPLPTGNRHRLRPGDRIALGKHDVVSFLFQIS